MKKISVCIVEDITDIRQALEQIIELSDACYLAGSFGNGQDALKHIPQLMPDVVLMDIGLGNMSGIDVVKELKEAYPQLLFLMCTVYEEEEKIFDALRAGASGYILKKSSPQDIIDAITELTEGGAPMSSQIARKVVGAFQKIPELVGAIPKEKDRIKVLTSREHEILELLAQGLTVRQISEKLFIAPLTVRKHLYHIYEKLHVNNKVEAINKFFGWQS
jgi:DNA-binding NarL/FixJ family response regulator